MNTEVVCDYRNKRASLHLIQINAKTVIVRSHTGKPIKRHRRKHNVKGLYHE